MSLTHFSLFSGIGGIDLAAEWAGFRTVAQCEIADYPTKVLEKHWPNVPRWRNIRDVTRESFQEKTGLQTVDLLSGGFPCQPFSVAGKRRGKEDDRYLWPEMLRVIREVRPAWVLGENVAGIVNMALDQVYADLEAQGYEVQAFIIPACGVNAPHRRDRVFIVAHAAGVERNARSEKQGILRTLQKNEREHDNAGRPGETRAGDVSNPSCQLCQWNWRAWAGRKESTNGLWRATQSRLGRVAGGLPDWVYGYWDSEPNIPRIAKGVSNRANRLKCLGNAVVPQQVYPILKAIADIEYWRLKR